MKKILIAVGGVFALLVSCGVGMAAGGQSTGSPAATTTVTKTVKAPAPKAAAAKEETESDVSTCDAVREALLTGTKAEIKQAMKDLVADKSADANAREAARDYLNRTDPDLKESAASLVQLGCSI